MPATVSSSAFLNSRKGRITLFALLVFLFSVLTDFILKSRDPLTGRVSRNPFVFGWRFLKHIVCVIFAPVEFVFDFVTFVLNRLNGFFRYLKDRGLAELAGRIGDAWNGLCDGTPACRSKEAERLRAARERLERLAQEEDEE
jgi:hypothetical protein